MSTSLLRCHFCNWKFLPTSVLSPYEALVQAGHRDSQTPSSVPTSEVSKPFPTLVVGSMLWRAWDLNGGNPILEEQQKFILAA